MPNETPLRSRMTKDLSISSFLSLEQAGYISLIRYSYSKIFKVEIENETEIN